MYYFDFLEFVGITQLIRLVADQE